MHGDAFLGSDDSLGSVAFAPDGRLLANAVAGPIEGVRLWAVHPATAPQRPVEPPTPALADFTPIFDHGSDQGRLF